MLSAPKGDVVPGNSRPPDILDARMARNTGQRATLRATTPTRRAGRAERVRLAIRSALAGVAIALLTVGSALAESGAPVYTVQPGDNLNEVAARLGISTAALIRANGIGDADVIAIGQVLRLPDGTVTPDRPVLASRGNRVGTREFQWPLHGPITTYFAEPGALWRIGYHPGLDIGVPVGTPIRAIGEGEVVEAEGAGYNRGYGHYVKVDHGDGLHSLYAHMSTVTTRVGERVGSGALLGHVGVTGFTTGPHLHLEVRQDGVIRDPLLYIGR